MLGCHSSYLIQLYIARCIGCVSSSDCGLPCAGRTQLKGLLDNLVQKSIEERYPTMTPHVSSVRVAS